ncbi:hypothetical protein [Scleromatobacter humisilvae]|uniref:DUF2846 domain-containing protein n=1 Tax=Scleromatobacter humisilvae TaxID=2897159 RepID=A0A9X2C281_9BURK|nr:hypothetical protein [Scleromatobacter humisilvae]MCK9689628.1 hypothetical protein [Scleromatobacter humisilvae]
MAFALTLSMLLVGCATGVTNFDDQASIDPHSGYVLLRPHWDDAGDTEADLQIKLVHYYSDGSKQAIVYTMPAGATQVATLEPGYYKMVYAIAGRTGVAPLWNTGFVVKTGQVSYPGDWWFHQATVGYANVLAPRKQNFHQHKLIAAHSEVERDPEAERLYQGHYPRLSQVLPLVYTGP